MRRLRAFLGPHDENLARVVDMSVPFRRVNPEEILRIFGREVDREIGEHFAGFQRLMRIEHLGRGFRYVDRERERSVALIRARDLVCENFVREPVQRGLEFLNILEVSQSSADRIVGFEALRESLLNETLVVQRDHPVIVGDN